jgi:hypothetical protein
MRDCFGPFRAAGVDWGIRLGGGFWCRDGAGALVLRDTPAPVSEVHALDPVDSVGGELALRSRGPVTVSLTADDGHAWALSVRPALSGGARVETTVDGRQVGPAVELPDGVGRRALRISFESVAPEGAGVADAGAGVVARVPEVEGGDLSIKAARGSEARVELGGLELER